MQVTLTVARASNSVISLWLAANVRLGMTNMSPSARPVLRSLRSRAEECAVHKRVAGELHQRSRKLTDCLRPSSLGNLAHRRRFPVDTLNAAACRAIASCLQGKACADSLSFSLQRDKPASVGRLASQSHNREL